MGTCFSFKILNRPKVWWMDTKELDYPLFSTIGYF